MFGKDDVFFASGRLDDLASVHAGVVALAEAVEELGGSDVAVAVAPDDALAATVEKVLTAIRTARPEVLEPA